MKTRDRKYEVPAHARFAPCKGCTKPVTYIRTETSKRMPIETDGTPHWLTCPASKDVREKKQLEERLAELRAQAGGSR